MIINLVTLENHSWQKYLKKNLFGQTGIKVEMMKVKMFNFLCKTDTACKILALSEKKKKFLFWLIKDFQGYKRKFEGL